ncbi:MAG: DUF2628 domain-containing protein [Clostridia bacterium]|nr:DUF2628 domain-containing protein [Clostridia bacterium]
MTFRNNQCPVCGRTFTDEDDIVVCPECGTPHHRVCWEQYGHCANRARHGNYQYVNTAPPEDDGERERGEKRPSQRLEWTCKSCGRENPVDAESCEYCGAPRPFAARVRMAAETMEDPGTVPPNVMVDGIPAEEEAQFIGPGATRYLFRFIEMDKRDAKVSWNWGAALFGPFWCFYRKMYSVGLLYLLVMVIVAIICIPAGFGEYIKGALNLMTGTMDYTSLVEYISSNSPTMAPWQEAVSYAVRVVMSIALGLFGNYLYRGKVKKSILRIRELASDMETYYYLLARKGRVSIAMPILFAILYGYIQSFAMMGFALLLGL